MKELVTAKITPQALKLIRLIAAMTGEKQCEALERVFKAEWEWLQQK